LRVELNKILDYCSLRWSADKNENVEKELPIPQSAENLAQKILEYIGENKTEEIDENETQQLLESSVEVEPK